MSTAEEFTEFAVGAAPRLRRTAFLLCGDWHTAEDLTQTTLARMFVSWRRISRQDAVYGYASRTLVNAFLSDRRRRRGRELLTGWLPEHPDLAAVAAPEVRMVVLDALATLPPRTRVVVVMRYWADLSVEQVPRYTWLVRSTTWPGSGPGFHVAAVRCPRSVPWLVFRLPACSATSGSELEELDEAARAYLSALPRSGSRL